MSTYAGNPSLSAAVKDRVNSTFQQTLGIYQQGRLDEVVQGCEFILQMDPTFDPARKLLEKVRNPGSTIDVEAPSPVNDVQQVMQQARAAMASRDYQRVIQLTTEVLTNDLMNDDARVLSDRARNRMEAGPFIDQFFRKFDEHIAAGNIVAARGDLDKARALDSEHPSIVRMEQMLSIQQSSSISSPGADTRPSFVVDTPITPRTSAPASDFGFTFEEEKAAAPAEFGGGFSFDSSAPSAPAAGTGGFGSFSFETPAAPATPVAAPKNDAPFAGGFSFDAPAPAGGSGGFSFDSSAPDVSPGTFDFSSTPADTTPADQKKIDQYLADGDRSFDSADYQQAIDHWSRIFLIDVTNEAASERIERAKAKRREVEQRIEPLLNAGAAAFEKGDRDTARGKFVEVLGIDPSNPTAHDFNERISQSKEVGAPAPPPASTFGSGAALDDGFFDDAATLGDSLPPSDSKASAPAPGKAAKATSAKKVAPAAPTKPLPMGLIGAVLAVIVLLGGGWFAWQKLTKASTDPGTTQTTLAQAKGLAQRGKYDQAILLLQDVKPDDPQHDIALNMIADLQHKKTLAAEMVDGRPAAVVYQEALSNGKTLYGAHDYDGAKKQLETAMRVKALPADMKAAYDASAQQVAKLDSARALFGERHYQDAIANLGPLAQADPQNQNIQRLLLDAHFNMGATALQEEKLSDAIHEFDEVLKADPGDELAKRSKELAVRYNNQQKDLLYRIYVRYLPLRKEG